MVITPNTEWIYPRLGRGSYLKGFIKVVVVGYPSRSWRRRQLVERCLSPRILPPAGYLRIADKITYNASS